MKKNIYLLFLCFPVFSLAESIPIQVKANLNPTCVFSVSAVNFGVWNPSAPAIYGNGSSQQKSNLINVLCTRTTPFTIKGMPYISKGTVVGKYMKGATTNQDIIYTVYTSQELGVGSWFSDGGITPKGKTDFITNEGTGNNQVIALYFYLYNAAVYPQKWVTPDTYTDNYTLTLGF